MRLTLHTDYALRSLIYLAAAGEAGGTASSIAARYKISENHLRKVMQKLVAFGFVQSARGRGGGLRLARLSFPLSPPLLFFLRFFDDFPLNF